jgi:hypothetical protein
LKEWKPLFYENNVLPKLLSKISPIDVWAVSVGPFVWCRGELSETTKRHETIHFQQQLEMMFVLKWVLYFAFYAIGRLRYGSWKEGYYENPFEREAYAKQDEHDYLKNRKRYAWLEFIK